MRDLQRRLTAAGHGPAGGELGMFCAATAAALSDFQRDRGLRETDTCDEDTWRAIVEATWKLGDRLLLLVAPNLRGDDVSELQSLLARLGFDSGRVDGIFGHQTHRAVTDFQQNSGMYVDGVCGHDTVRALHVLARQTGSGSGIAALREHEALTASARSLADLRMVVGHFGGFASLSRQLVQALRHHSAAVVASDEPDAVIQASIANRFAANVYIGFEPMASAFAKVNYYAVPQFESARGRALATEIVARCSTAVSGFKPELQGMRLPVLRETKMTAVLLSLGPVSTVLDEGPPLVAAIVDAVEAWAAG